MTESREVLNTLHEVSNETVRNPIITRDIDRGTWEPVSDWLSMPVLIGACILEGLVIWAVWHIVQHGGRW
jgi:hypothetical protein